MVTRNSNVVRNIIVIGGSAGSIFPLKEIVHSFQDGFQAAVLVVVHLSPSAPSRLAEILATEGPDVFAVTDSMKLRQGFVYVATPDRHLTVVDHEVRVSHGPRENRHRPAIDTLFRSAARAFGPQVIGVILSGLLDDGAAGLQAVKALGGTTVVQEASDAAFPDMPRNALRYNKVDHVLPASKIGPLLVGLVEGAGVAKESTVKNGKRQRPRVKKTNTHLHATAPGQGEGRPSVFACPECHGVLWEVNEGGGLVRFECRVGHAYSPQSLAIEMTNATENALWAAVRALEEKSALSERLAATMKLGKLAGRFREDAMSNRSHAAVLRDTLLRQQKPETAAK